MRKKSSVLSTFVFAVIFFVGGLMAHNYITKPIGEEAKASKEWPTVEGVVSHSSLNKTRNSDGQEMYSANIEYTYSVDSCQYVGSSIKVGNTSSSSKTLAKNQLRKYARGNNVIVYYDPDFHNSAVLEPGIGLVLAILLKLPLFFCVIAVLMVFSLLKRLFLGH